MLLNDRLNKQTLGGSEGAGEIQEIRDWNQN